MKTITCITLCLAVSCGTDRAEAEAAPPHIVILLADDLGWNDVGYHGSEIRTPRIDRLAREGVRLERFYVHPACSPTRAALMTGRYPFRQGLQVGVIRSWDDYGLPKDERTLAEALQAAGYQTAITGKWHLGHSDRGQLPQQRGFEHQYGLYSGWIDYFKHSNFNGPDWYRDGEAIEEEGYATDLIASEAVRIVRERDPERPLFLYVPFNAPHSPPQAPQTAIARYAELADPKRRVYAAMVEQLDAAVGRIVDALDEAGMSDQTLVLFASDNGASATFGGDNGRLRGGKGSLYEGGIRVPAIARFRGTLPAGGSTEQPIQVADLYPTLLRLAGASLEQTLPLDGVDVWPTLMRGEAPARDEIVHSATPTRGALRRGRWKLVVRRAGSGETYQLFDVERDPYEKRNRAGVEPQRLRELRARLDAYREQAAPPLGGRGSSPSQAEP